MAQREHRDVDRALREPDDQQTGENQRDNARELELKAKLEGELPIEEDLTRWFGLYDAPI